MKRDAGLHFLRSEDWDLFMVGFKEAHCAGHHLWDLVSDDVAARSRRLGNPMKTILQTLDRAVENLVAAAGSDSRILVFTPTEMVPTSSLTHLMPEIVRRVNKELARSRRRRFREILLGEKHGDACELLPYNENCTALRLHGTASAGGPEEVSDLASRVEELFRELVDESTGTPVVSGVDRPSREQEGARSDRLPDVLVRYRPGLHPTSVRSSRLGRILAPLTAVRPGDHAAGGFLISSHAPVNGLDGVHQLGDFVSALLSDARRSGD
jgi:hypothetical protein